MNNVSAAYRAKSFFSSLLLANTTKDLSKLKSNKVNSWKFPASLYVMTLLVQREPKRIKVKEGGGSAGEAEEVHTLQKELQ